jgi:hypothetical protein
VSTVPPGILGGIFFGPIAMPDADPAYRSAANLELPSTAMDGSPQTAQANSEIWRLYRFD